MSTLAATPHLAESELASLVARHWGLSGQIRPLPSERDQNARLSCAAGEFVIKIANPAEPPAETEMQIAVLEHLAGQHVPGLPRIRPSLAGAATVAVECGGRMARMRLVSWIAGVPLAQTPRSAAQLHDLGRYMGRLTRGLQGFVAPAAHRPEFPWSLDHVAGLRHHVGSIADLGRRAMVEALFARHAERVLPRLPGLRCSVLHQDANDHNVITDPAAPERIVGLIDFGDMCHGRTVNELAVTLAYALLEAEEPLAAATALIGGFHSAFPLHEAEAELVLELALIRLAASVCLSSVQAAERPDNAYLLISQAPAFAALERMHALPPDLLAALGRSAAGFEPVAGAKASLAALSPAAPLLTPAPARLPRVPLVPGENVAPGALRARHVTPVAEDVPVLGLLGWGAEQGDGTRGLGVDLHLPAGYAIHAPFAARIARAEGTGLLLEPAPGVFLGLFGLVPCVQPDVKVAATDTLGHATEAPLHVQLMLGLPDAQPRTAPAALWPLWSALRPDPSGLLGFEPESYHDDPEPPEALLTRRQARIGPSLSLSYRHKLKMVRGRGAWLVDHTGRHWLDTVNNIAHVGHEHPRVAAALAAQAAELNTNSRYLHPLMLSYAERLTATLPEPLEVAYFVNSGTEANELALRIARTALGRKETLVLDWAYHGNSGGTVEISPYKFRRAGGFPQPDFLEIAPFPDPYRGTHRGPDSAAAYVAGLEARLEALATRTGSGAATFIAESASGVGGQVFYPEGYLARAYAAVRDRGGLCIADEVQCGMGRIGSHFWAFEAQGAVPDIVVIGKPVGNGHPMAAVVTTRDLAARFANGMEYFNSFGGNPVSMAVGHAVLDVIEEEDLQSRAAATGAHLRAGLERLAERHAVIGDVRGSGLFLGAELVADRDSRAPATAAAAELVHQLYLRGILASTDGPDDNVLKIKPPMVFGQAEADLLLDEIGRALSHLNPQD